MKKTIIALTITNILSLGYGVTMQSKYQESKTDWQKMYVENITLKHNVKKLVRDYNTLSRNHVDLKNTYLTSRAKNRSDTCVDHETYGYALSYAASLEIGVRDIDAYSYIESFDRGAILEARDIAAEHFKLATAVQTYPENPTVQECYGIRHIDITVCKVEKTKKCTQWIGGDFNTPDYSCDLFNLYKSNQFNFKEGK